MYGLFRSGGEVASYNLVLPELSGGIMKTKFMIAGVTVVILTAGIALHHSPIPVDAPIVAEINSNETNQPAGYVIHIDPVTGAIVEKSATSEPILLNEKMRDAFSRSEDGLVEVASPVEGGGTMINLEGRYQNSMVSTVDENGELQAAPCLSGVEAQPIETAVSESAASESTTEEK